MKGFPCVLSWTKTGDTFDCWLVFHHAFSHLVFFSKILLKVLLPLWKPHYVTLRGGMFPTDMYFINRVLSHRVTKNFQKKGDAYESL